MAQVLRLLRYGLLLRLMVEVAGEGLRVAFGRFEIALSNASLSIPTALVLIGVMVCERREAVGARTVNFLLGAAIVAYVFNITLGTLVFQSELLNPASELRQKIEQTRGIEAVNTLRFAATVPLFFMLVPMVLGAWTGGSRGALRWIAFSLFLIGLSLGSLAYFESELVPFQLGNYVSQGSVVAVICLFVGSLADEQRKREAEMEQANARLTEQAHVREQLATTRERVRLARDLHDTMAHSLAGVVVQLDAASALASAVDPAIRQQLEVAKTAAKRGLSDTRAAIGDLRGTMIEDLGLVEALRRHTGLISRNGSAPATFEYQPAIGGDAGTIDGLDEKTSETFYRIAQEALHNAQRHAGADAIHVKLGANTHEVRLSVRDNGTGFDPRNVPNERFGLRGMRERAELIGAQLRINTAVGASTEVVLTLPIKK